MIFVVILLIANAVSEVLLYNRAVIVQAGKNAAILALCGLGLL